MYVLNAWLLHKTVSTVFYIGMHTSPTFYISLQQCFKKIKLIYKYFILLQIF